jgi:hypothetical protein
LVGWKAGRLEGGGGGWGLSIGGDGGEELFGGVEGFEEVIGLMGGELISAEGSGGDGDDAGAAGSGAADVFWGIADDDDAAVFEGDAVMFEDALFGDGAELVTVVMIIAEGAGLEVVIDAVVGELDEGGALNIAGQEGEGMGAFFLESIEEGGDAVEEGPILVDVNEMMGEFFEIGVEEGAPRLVRLFDTASLKEPESDAGVGGAGEFDGGHVMGGDVEGIAKGLGDGATSGATSIEQGAVDIEKKETGTI